VLAAAYDDGTVELRQVNGEPSPVTFAPSRGGQSVWISAAAPSPDSQLVALASIDVKSAQGSPQPAYEVAIYNRNAPEKPIKVFKVGAAVRHLAWSASGDRVAAALEDKTALVYRLEGDAEPVAFHGHKAWLTRLDLSPDNRWLVTTSLDRTALVFDMEAGGARPERHEHGGAVYAAAFDPTGKRFATACADGKVRVFELGGSRAPLELNDKGGELLHVAWSADGTRLAAASSTGAILVWSNLSWPLGGAPRPIVLEGKAPADALAFLDGGEALVAASRDRTYTWRLAVKTLRKDLLEDNDDCLQPEDRTLYLQESRDIALKAFLECESERGRRRPAEAPPSPRADQGIVVARLIVLPGNAEIEIDGAPVRRRDGLLELSGRAGDRRKVRLVKDGDSIEKEVTIERNGASLQRIDLDEEVAKRGAPSPSPLEILNNGNYDILMPDPLK
jgi:hypothetical protein